MDVVDFNHEIFLMIMTMYLHGILGSVRIYIASDDVPPTIRTFASICPEGMV